MEPGRRLDDERRQLREDSSIIKHLIQNFPVQRAEGRTGLVETAPAARPLYDQLRRHWEVGNGGLAEF